MWTLKCPIGSKGRFEDSEDVKKKQKKNTSIHNKTMSRGYKGGADERIQRKIYLTGGRNS